MTTVLACCCLLLGTSTSQTPDIPLPTTSTFSTLATFDGIDGDGPYGALIQGTDGNLYGTTFAGGTYGFGTVFKVSTAGTITTLYSFCAQSQTNCPDGQNPSAGLIQATDGNFYGTTLYGGVYFCGATDCGTVFKITPAGALTTLHSFDSLDGEEPNSGLIQASDGNLYGTTGIGGPNGGGVVFKITPGGTLTTMASFCDPFNTCSGGNEPTGLVLGTDGSIYGTTYSGGTNGGGIFFKITTGGTMTTIYNFCSLPNCADGGNPIGELYQATNGIFYGTTSDSGANFAGSVFSITVQGKVTTLHSFNVTDGSAPLTGVTQATDGNFYGTTAYGGTYGDGTVFKMTRSGTVTTLHGFDYTDGYAPSARPAQDTNGVLYGTTPYSSGGGYHDGTIFSEAVGLGAFVETQTASGKVGNLVVILGTNLTGASKVTFNGTPATFTVVSSSEITATVPTGATTGPVVVTTPRGTLTSNKKFRVTH